MNFDKLAEIAVRDPLAEVTRRERKSLLGVSILAIAIVHTGLIPARISALGVEFSQADQRSLFHVLAAVVLYYLTAFTIYAAADFMGWSIAYASVYRAEMTEPLPTEGKPSERESELLKRIEDYKRREVSKHLGLDLSDFSEPPRYTKRLRWSPRISFVRSLFEFWLPIIIGLYATALLFTSHPSPEKSTSPENTDQRAKP